MRLPKIREVIYFKIKQNGRLYAEVTNIDFEHDRIWIKIYDSHKVFQQAGYITFDIYFENFKLRSVNYLPDWF